MYFRKTLTRCLLASDTLQVLIQSVACVPNPYSAATESPWGSFALASSSAASCSGSSQPLQIRSYFRQCVSTGMILDFVQLGIQLDEKLIQPRLAFVSHQFTSTFDHITSRDRSAMIEVSKLFELCERQLWVAHISLALAIGQGWATNVSGGGGGLQQQQQQQVPIQCLPLDGSEGRLQIFHTIVNAAAAKGNGGDGKQEQLLQASMEKKSKNANPKASLSDYKLGNVTKQLWPLCLPAAQHALVASLVLSCDIRSSEEDEMADNYDENSSSQADLMFLCESFLNSLEAHTAQVSQPSSTDSASTSILLSRTDTALISLRDARLFAVAITKLNRDGQKDMLARCIGILHSFVSSFESSRDSSVFARAITLCCTLVDLISSPDLKSSLFAALESSGYKIPCLIEITPPLSATSLNQNSVWSKDIFQNLLADWQSPSIPYSTSTISSTEMILQEDNYKQVESLLTSALELGVQVSKLDGCHLLFSSWNAMGKLPAWTAKSWPGPCNATLVKKSSEVNRLIRLREDMCEVHHLMTLMNASSLGSQSQQQPDTLLMKVAQSKISSYYRSNASEALLNGLSNSQKVLGYCTLDIGKKDQSQTPSLAEFAYYEALPLYISFLMSMHTRPGANDFGRMHRLHRSPPRSRTARGPYFSDEDTVDFDSSDSNVGIVRRNALNRLHEVW